MANEPVKILCVDDDQDLLLINSTLLQLAGHHVITANSGKECLDIMKQEKPDIVLLDVMLPDIPGLEVCKTIKSDPEAMNTFVILISGLEVSSTSQIRGLETGADGYITRPISNQEFLARIQAMIRLKYAETALRKSKERYQLLVETMNEGLVVIDEDGLITFANEKNCEFLGYARHEIIGRAIGDFLDEHNRKIFEMHWSERERGRGKPYEITWTRKDGEKISTITSPRQIFDNGNLQGSFAIITDITSRKKIEDALRESEERFRTIFEKAIDGILIAEPEEKKFFAGNRAICQMLGYASEELKGLTVYDIHPRQYLSSILDQFEKMHRGELKIANDIPVKRKNGIVIYVDISCSHIMIGGQKYLLGIFRDITERKQAEESIKNLNEKLEQRVVERTRQLEAVVDELESEIIERKRAENALRENEEKFRAITRAAADAIILMNDEEKISYWNPAAEQIFGYTKKEALGKALHLLIVPDQYHEAYQEGFRIFRETGQGPVIGKTLEFLAVKKDGSIFPIEISISVINLRGKWEAVGIIRDITERKLDEKTLVQYAERLQTLSARLIEIQEAERRYIAQELHDEIGQSLTGLKLSLENITMQSSGEIAAQLQEKVSLVQEIQSRIRNMSLGLRPSMLDDLGLLPALLWHIDRYSNQTKIKVHLSHEGLHERFSPEIETAAYRIVQEALTNVARHAGVSDVTVHVTANKELLEIHIRDVGRGFHRDSVNDDANTAGIKWMQERLSLLGGRLKIDSSPGEGTHLTAYIPLKSRYRSDAL